MSKIAKESILLLSLFLIAAMVQFFAQSLPMALCFYFLPTLYSAYYFGRRHSTMTAFAGVFLVVLLDFLNNMMPAHRVLTLPGERLFNFARRFLTSLNSDVFTTYSGFATRIFCTSACADLIRSSVNG